MKFRVASTTRNFLLRLASAGAIVLACVLISRAGGPKWVAGTSYFDPSTTGQALIWPEGTISYFTDQGDLSAILQNGSANSFVADAFSQWSSVATAALNTRSGGTLAEDVNGTNVMLNADNTISMPADIQPTAIGTPIGIVYDSDGSVTDALLGTGAGGASQCFFNSAFGGNDTYGQFASYQHALIVINGLCAQQPSQLTDLEYRLVRVIGGVLGVGWSQVNSNVQTGFPRATPDDYVGFPVMHFSDAFGCVPITLCYPNPYQLSMDDKASISRLYPITAQNQSSFPGKQIFSATTARIHGSVWFSDSHKLRTQPMQGLNVVARWIDPQTGLPSRRYAASSVSGFLFSGNAGNPITGPNDALGDAFARWGSDNSALEGFFDLAGLQLPNGGSAQYQISVEGIDARWSPGVGPYSPGPVSPSGTFPPVTLTVSGGSDLLQDIVMLDTEQPVSESSSMSSPATLPLSADWVASLTGFGDADYFLFPAKADRTLSIQATALDESGGPTVVKAQPVIGMWEASDPQGTLPPAFTPSPFNQLQVGTTRLDAQVLASGNFIVGFSDVRGDGRPDYRYHAHVLYGDSALPSRVSVNGGAVIVQGTGFSPGLTTLVGIAAAGQLAVDATQITLQAPAHGDGTQDISITDPVSGSSSVMTRALTYGAAATDKIVLLYAGNPPTPVGTQAAHPVTVRVLAADGVTPINGATIGWSASNSLQLSACAGSSSCSAMTNESGSATSWLTPGVAGISNVTATLAPGVYSPPNSVSAILSATQTSSDIGVSTPYLWISQGATVSVPLTARLMSNGLPSSNVQVNFTIVSGSGKLNAASALTDSSGYSTVTLSVTNILALVQVSICAAPGNAPCAVVYGNPVPSSQQKLQAISGAGQISTGQAFQPVVVRVIDSSSPPNSVIAAPVTVLTTVLRPGGTSPVGGDGEINVGNPAMPVILQASQSNMTADLNGITSIVPSSAGFAPPLEVDVAVTTGTTARLDYPLQVFSTLTTGSGSVASKRPAPARIIRRLETENH